jgi:hypothetical protein
MTPHRRNGRGTLVIDRCFDSLGRIRRSSGTNDAAVFKEIDGMLTALWSMGRPDLLEEIRDGRVRPVVALGWFRLGRLDRIPTGEMLRPFQATWEEWSAKLKNVSASHRRDLLATLRALGFEKKPTAARRIELERKTVGDSAALFEALVEAKEGKARTIQKAKANLMAFLRDKVGDDHPAYRAVRRIQIETVEVQRQGRPLLPAEVRDIMGRMSEGAADVWTLCATGMLPDKEYRKVWRVLPGRIEIDGTKTRSRKRVVPSWTTVTRPTVGYRKLQRLVAKATGGAVLLKDFRDTFARWMREAGVSTLNRSLYMGHGAKTMTEHYEWGEIPGQLETDAAKLASYAGAPGLRLHVAEGA